MARPLLRLAKLTHKQLWLAIRTHGWRDRVSRPWYYLALGYADLGDREYALTALNKSYENRHLEVLWLLVDPELDPLRSDPRFQELVRKVGSGQPSS